MFRPIAGISSARRAGSVRTASIPIARISPTSWSSTTSGSAPTTTSDTASDAGSTGTIDARQASSPSVKVVSIPEPE